MAEIVLTTNDGSDGVEHATKIVDEVLVDSQFVRGTVKEVSDTETKRISGEKVICRFNQDSKFSTIVFRQG